MSDENAHTTIRALGTRYRQRQLSPVEVTRTLLEHIEQLDSPPHAFVTLTADRALADACRAETIRAPCWASRWRTKTSTARGVSAPRAVGAAGGLAP
jgi:Asp-tRNA(Asn)/Glu-tRNA(Gln) amidotransferase A subunit family amidase